METFDGRPAEPIATVPTLFRRYVDRALREHPGLLRSIEAVIGHIRDNPARPSADLDDDDVNAIRETWAKTLTVEERSIRLYPVEDLAHEGWVLKRVREEGGGYRFTFQAVAEYLIYLDLLRAKPEAEDELAYWTRRVVPGPVFPEYAGAFTFLLRDWAQQGKLGLAARIAESAPQWFVETLVSCLESLWASDPQNLDIGIHLADALFRLGDLFDASARIAEDQQTAERYAERLGNYLFPSRSEGVKEDYYDSAVDGEPSIRRILIALGRGGYAEDCYKRAGQVYEELFVFDKRTKAERLRIALLLIARRRGELDPENLERLRIARRRAERPSGKSSLVTRAGRSMVERILKPWWRRWLGRS
jgi:hypothetical protein